MEMNWWIVSYIEVIIEWQVSCNLNSFIIIHDNEYILIS